MFTPFPPRVGSNCPWGRIDHVSPLVPEVVEVSTSSHGGLWVSLAALARIPEAMRKTQCSGDGWYEEDCDWCIPYLVLGLDQFEPTAARGAEVAEAAWLTLRRWHPDHEAALAALQAVGAGHE